MIVNFFSIVDDRKQVLWMLLDGEPGYDHVFLDLRERVGKRCKNIDEDKAESVVFGYVPIIDMTAEDILQRNPRFLTVAKSFDTFFSFGPMILTPDEIKDIQNLSVSTVHNNHVEKSNRISNMIFPLNKLISFHSKVMTMEPGDIISTGTPGAVVINDGDTVECRIDNFPALSNNVKSD